MVGIWAPTVAVSGAAGLESRWGRSPGAALASARCAHDASLHVTEDIPHRREPRAVLPGVEHASPADPCLSSGQPTLPLAGGGSPLVDHGPRVRAPAAGSGAL